MTAWIWAHIGELAAVAGAVVALLTLAGTTLWAGQRITYQVGLLVGTVNAHVDGLGQRVGDVEDSVKEVHRRLDAHLEAAAGRRPQLPAAAGD